MSEEVIGRDSVQRALAFVAWISLQPVGTPRDVVAALASWLAAPEEPEPLVVETSGSTGAPKRVAAVASRRAGVGRGVGAPAGRHRAVAARAARRRTSRGCRSICRSLVAGHEPLLLDEHGSVAGGVAAGARFVSLVPTQLHRLLDDAAEARGAGARCHTVLLGGGPIDPALRARAEAAGVHVVATYGSAETAGGCVYDGYAARRRRAGDRRRTAGSGSAGRPCSTGTTATRPPTAEALVDGWFLTSDAGRLDEDGRLHVLGRLDDVVVTGGVNVPGPAVAARLREHPAVEAAEVVGVPDEEWGNRLVAFVVGDLALDEARAWVAEAHPRSWAPRQVVVVDALPLLANGKVDRLRLQATWHEGLVDPDAHPLPRHHGPRGRAHPRRRRVGGVEPVPGVPARRGRALAALRRGGRGR